MTKYLLDSHILIWLLTDDNRLNRNIRADIEYFQHPYYVSVETLREIVILQSLKRIKLDYDLDKITIYLKEIQISILSIELDHIKTLEKLPIFDSKGKEHHDPFDRMLIAQSITEKFTVISSDGKFPPYKEYGLKLLVN
jgi:PIN domain nuclease of toxin-antitoxin system